MNSRGASAADIFAKLQLRGESSASWFVIISGGRASSASLREFSSDLGVLAGSPVRVMDCKETPFAAIVASLQNPNNDTVALAGLDKWLAADWEALDLNRSGLERRGPLIFWMSEKAADRMFEHAPNIRSYLASSLFHPGSDGSEITEPERLSRLQELSERFGMSNDEVVRKAEERTLPPSPSFVEWLILLKRGDLV